MTVSTDEKLAALWEQVVECVAKEDWDGIIDACNQIIAINPNDATTYCNRGVAYREKGEYDRAIKDYDKAIEHKPDYAAAYCNRGVTYRKKREYDRAIKDYDKAIEHKPDYAAAYCNRGVTYRKKREYDRAIKDYDKAIDLESDYAAAYNNCGFAYHEKREYDRAIKYYDKAIDLESDDATVYYNRGFAYHEKGEYDRAIKDYSKAIDIKPDDATVYYNRGFAYHEKGEYDRAIKDYSKAIDIKPDDAEAYYNRGVAYGKKGEYDCALVDFSEAYKKGLKGYIILYLAYTIKNIRPQSDNVTLFKCFIEVSKAINNIKNELHKKTESYRVVHYCALTTLKSMSDGEPFRFYNVAYMNDPEEGEALFRMMPEGNAIAAAFYGKDAATYHRYQPYYIGSFIDGEENADKIVFWRTYGKNEGTDAAGCSLVFDQQQFSDTLKAEIEGMKGMTSPGGSDEKRKPCLYRVVYEGAEEIEKTIEGMLKKLHDRLDTLIKEIEEEKESNNESKQKLKLLGCALIDSIRYLFKSKHYEHEQEMRVVEYIGSEDKENKEDKEDIKEDIKEDEGLGAPKLYVEPYKNTEFCFSEVVLGPKTENGVVLGVWVSKKKPGVTVKKSILPYR